MKRLTGSQYPRVRSLNRTYFIVFHRLIASFFLDLTLFRIGKLYAYACNSGRYTHIESTSRKRKDHLCRFICMMLVTYALVPVALPVYTLHSRMMPLPMVTSRWSAGCTTTGWNSRPQTSNANKCRAISGSHLDRSYHGFASRSLFSCRQYPKKITLMDVGGGFINLRRESRALHTTS